MRKTLREGEIAKISDIKKPESVDELIEMALAEEEAKPDPNAKLKAVLKEMAGQIRLNTVGHPYGWITNISKQIDEL